MSQRKRNCYVTQRQKQMLIQMLKKNNSNKWLLRSNFENKTTWDEVAMKMNAMGGAIKDAKTWKKTWQDMKRNLREKAARVAKLRNKIEDSTGDDMMIGNIVSVKEESLLPLIDSSTIHEMNGIAESTHLASPLDSAQIQGPSAGPYESSDILNGPFEPTCTSTFDLPGASNIPSESQGFSTYYSLPENSVKTENEILENGPTRISAKETYYKQKIQLLQTKNDLYRKYIALKEEQNELLKQDILVKTKIADRLDILVNRQ